MNRNIHLVEKFLSKTHGHQLKPLQYVEGEKHLYLGKEYPLAIYHGTGRRKLVTFIDGEIRVNTPTSQREKIQAVLQNWYLHQARAVFSERMRDIVLRAPWAKGKDIPVKLRRMKRTWGNCSSGGVIKLNTHLVKAPLQIIDSVITHELCHLEEMNHGRAFYVLLDGLNPEWRQDRVRLRAEAPVYLLT